MPTETLPTRTPPRTRESSLRGFGWALALHGLVAAGLMAAAYISHSSHRWGDQNPTAGSIQASMVNSIPLPPKQRYVDKEVLTSDNTSVAPKIPPAVPETKARSEAAKPKTEPVPRPNEVLIPDKVVPPKAAKPADRVQPEVTHKPVTPPPPTPTPKATTGETSGVQIPMSVTQLKNGTASITVDDRSFGDRYAYYVQLISRKIAQSKSEGDPDGSETRGKHTVIRFIIARDGTPTDATVEQKSGSGALDTSTLRAIQRIDTFGPLPQGDHFVVHFEYDSR